MMIEKFSVTAFKCLSRTELDLSPINVLVGGNNSGKSCILQAVHFGIALSQSRRIAGSDQFPPERLRYCPTDDFLDLRHGRRLTEGGSIDFEYSRVESDEVLAAKVSLQRGRNGVVKAPISGAQILAEISDPKGFFSIYVPGLAGVSIREEYRSELVVNNGIARGDANLYLRNVLLRINRNADRKARFQASIRSIFPDVEIKTEFDEGNDLWLRSTVRLPSGHELPLDMVGTGLLQAIQLIAYVSNYSPKLLLLDEPDAHLHPSNQRLLAKTLGLIAESTETKILIATHSRHMLDALSAVKASRLFWIKDGVASPQDNWSDIAILMDLGALDSAEHFLAGEYRYLVWTEDDDTKYLEALLIANGIRSNETMVFSYQSSSKIDSAKLMTSFVERVRPGVRIIVHRDRDFMTDDEIARLTERYKLDRNPNMRLFVTRGSDVESYFTHPEHLESVMGKPLADCRTLVETALADQMVDFVIKFREKREEIKKNLYRNDPEACPPIQDFITGATISTDKAIGKKLLASIKNKLQEAGVNGGDILTSSEALLDENLKGLFS